jgi:hypothetical protein
MTEGERERLKVLLNRLTEHERKLAARASDEEDDFSPIERRLVDLLVVVKKRVTSELGAKGGS